MQSPGPQNPYEVYCHRCNVTAPVGTERCIHCGGRLAGAKDARRAALAAVLGTDAVDEVERADDVPVGIGSAAPRIAIWILLVIGGVLYRICG
ncbi:MAG TPA: hypothetical protein VEC18_02250 [Myxococcota bacterium]|nr:hypothetical protein [Myxococcota bacterium]